MGYIGDREPVDRKKGGKTQCRVRAVGGMASNIIPKSIRRKEAAVIEEEYGVPLPELTTSAKPGSADKLLVMRFRLMRGEQLFHPDDFDKGDVEE